MQSKSCNRINGFSVQLKLHQNYPNPTRELTTRRINLTRPGFTSLEIYDMNGPKIKSLCEEKLPAGTHEYRWNLDSDKGEPIAGGAYMCHFVSGKKSSMLKLIVE